MKRKIIFVLVALRILNIQLYFPVMAGKILYGDSIEILCSSGKQWLTIWWLGKNKLVSR